MDDKVIIDVARYLKSLNDQEKWEREFDAHYKEHYEIIGTNDWDDVISRADNQEILSELLTYLSEGRYELADECLKVMREYAAVDYAFKMMGIKEREN